MGSYYTETPDLNPTGDLVENARKNSSYKVLRLVLKCIFWVLAVTALLFAFSALSVGNKATQYISNNLGLNADSKLLSEKDIGAEYARDMETLEISGVFTANAIRDSYASKKSVLKSKDERLVKDAYAARAQRNEALMKEFTAQANSTRVELADLANAKNRIEVRLSKIEEERQNSYMQIISTLRLFYLWGIIMATVLLISLIYALYQACIVVIDIADCQVEIAIRGKTASG